MTTNKGKKPSGKTDKLEAPGTVPQTQQLDPRKALPQTQQLDPQKARPQSDPLDPEKVVSKAQPRPISSLVVGEPDNKRIGDQLDRLLAEAGASATLLLDKSGEVIAARGDVPTQDLNSLGALLAGTFATSREIARMLKESNFRSLFQQGMTQNTLTEMVGEGWIMVVLFDKSTHIGLVRDLCRQVTPMLEAVLLQVQRQSRVVSGLNPAFRTSVEDTIDLLFKE